MQPPGPSKVEQLEIAVAVLRNQRNTALDALAATMAELEWWKRLVSNQSPSNDAPSC